MTENDQFDKKSLLCFADPKKVKWKELAKDCVAFANTRGGVLLFGVEDCDQEPPAAAGWLGNRPPSPQERPRWAA
jgi:ATP-dependent DNA helicase RecG